MKKLTYDQVWEHVVKHVPNVVGPLHSQPDHVKYLLLGIVDAINESFPEYQRHTDMIGGSGLTERYYYKCENCETHIRLAKLDFLQHSVGYVVKCPGCGNEYGIKRP